MTALVIAFVIAVLIAVGCVVVAFQISKGDAEGQARKYENRLLASFTGAALIAVALLGAIAHSYLSTCSA